MFSYFHLHQREHQGRRPSIGYTLSSRKIWSTQPTPADRVLFRCTPCSVTNFPPSCRCRPSRPSLDFVSAEEALNGDDPVALGSHSDDGSSVQWPDSHSCGVLAFFASVAADAVPSVILPDGADDEGWSGGEGYESVPAASQPDANKRRGSARQEWAGGPEVLAHELAKTSLVARCASCLRPFLSADCPSCLTTRRLETSLSMTTGPSQSSWHPGGTLSARGRGGQCRTCLWWWRGSQCGGRRTKV